MRVRYAWLTPVLLLLPFAVIAQVKPKPAAKTTLAPVAIPPPAGPRFSKENPGTMNELFARVEKERKESEAAQAGMSGKPVVHITTVMEKHFVKATHLAESRPTSDNSKDIVGLWFAVPGRRADMVQHYSKEYKIVDGGREYWLPVHSRMIEWFPPETKKGDSMIYEIVWLGGRYLPTSFENVFLLNGFSVVPK
jgi:hypothetical protein